MQEFHLIMLEIMEFSVLNSIVNANQNCDEYGEFEGLTKPPREGNRINFELDFIMQRLGFIDPLN